MSNTRDMTLGRPGKLLFSFALLATFVTYALVLAGVI